MFWKTNGFPLLLWSRLTGQWHKDVKENVSPAGCMRPMGFSNKLLSGV